MIAFPSSCQNTAKDSIVVFKATVEIAFLVVYIFVHYLIMQLDTSANWKAFIKVKKESQISTSYNHPRQCVVMKWRPKVDGLPLQLSSTQVLDASGCCLKYATTCSKSCRLSTFVSFFLACFPCPKQSASRSD